MRIEIRHSALLKIPKYNEAVDLKLYGFVIFDNSRGGFPSSEKQIKQQKQPQSSIGISLSTTRHELLPTNNSQ